MTNEEKFQLIINFINKLIENDESISTNEQHDGMLIIQKTNFEDRYPTWIIYVWEKNGDSGKVSFIFKTGTRLSFKINPEQFVELKYKFNQLYVLSEKRAIKILNE